MKGKSRKLVAALLTIFMLINNSYEVLAATNISGKIDKAATQVNSLISSIDSKLSQIESTSQREDRENRDYIVGKKNELNLITNENLVKIKGFRIINNKYVDISWNSYIKEAKYELSINDKIINLGKVDNYLDSNTLELKKYRYKVRAIVDGKPGTWSEEKVYDRTRSENKDLQLNLFYGNKVKANALYSDTNKEQQVSLSIQYHIKYNATEDQAKNGWYSDIYQEDEENFGSKLVTGDVTEGFFGPNSQGVIDAIKIKLKNAPSDMGIKYQVCIKDNNAVSWEDWKADGEQSGKEGTEIKGIKIIISGNSHGYSIKYTASSFGTGGKMYDYAYNGMMSGSEVVNDPSINSLWLQLQKVAIIDKDTTWSGEKLVDGIVNVPKDVSLTISSGSSIKFSNKESGLVVEGKVIANGDSNNKIKLSPLDDNTKLNLFIAPNGSFQGSNIDFVGNVTGKDSLIDNSGQLNLSNSTLTNSKNNQGVGILGFDKVASINITNCKINKFEKAIEFDGGGDAKVLNNEINDNLYGIYLHTRLREKLSNAEISNNIFSNNATAVEITDGYGLKRNVSVYGNTIKSSTYSGISLSGENIPNVDIRKNSISNTNISKADNDNYFNGPIAIHGVIGSDNADLLAKINYSDNDKMNLLTNNNYNAIVFGNSTISSNCIIEKGKYNIVLTDSFDIDKGATLKLDKGIVLNARSNKTQDGKYNSTLNIKGNLTCNGTSSEPVIITSINDKDSGLIYIDNSDSRDSNFSEVFVSGLLSANNLICRNGICGIYNEGQVVLNSSTIIKCDKGIVNNSQFNIVNSILSDCKIGIQNIMGQLTIAVSKVINCDYGINVFAGKVNIINNIIQDCGTSDKDDKSLGAGIEFVDGDNPQIIANSFMNKVGNATALYNLSNKEIKAQNNFWGKDVGPNYKRSEEKYDPSKGLYVKGSVDYSNYSDRQIPPNISLIPDYNNQINDFITYQDYAVQRHFGEEGANISTGNFSRTANDLKLSSGGMDIEIYRTYNSRAKDNSSLIGNGWRFSYESSIKDIDSSSKITGKTITLPNGSVQSFELKTDGSYSPLDSRNKLVYTNNQYILTSKLNDKYIFSNNLLTEMRDKNDNKLFIKYDSNNNISSISDESGREYTLSYLNGKLSNITEKISGVSKRTITYNYSNNLLQSVTDVNGHVTEMYSYDSHNRLSQVIKDGKNIEEVSYFDDGPNINKIKTCKDVYDNVQNYEYNNFERSVKITDSNGNTRQQYYDSSMFNISTINPDGSIEEKTYSKDDKNINRYGEVVYEQDSLGNKKSYDVDERGNITKQTNPDDGYKAITYDANNNITKQVDESGNNVYFTYDSNGNITKKISPLNGKDSYSGSDNNFAVETYEYYTKQELQTVGCNVAGLVKTKTDANGGVTKYTYDKFGNPSTITDEEGNVTQYTYNEFGYKILEVSPNQFKTSYTYTNTGDIITTTYHDGSLSKTVYDGLGRKTKDITPKLYSQFGDAKGSETTYYPNGKVKSTKDEEGNVKEYTYDLYGNVKTEKAPNGSLYIYDYDNMNRVIKKSFKDNDNANPVTLEEYTYEILYGNSMNNNTLKVSKKAYIDSTNFTISSLVYNYNKQIIQTINEDQTTKKTEYMRNGIKAYDTDENGVNHYYNYDGLNRLISDYKPVDNSSGEVLYSYSKYDYDKKGNKIKEATGKELVKKEGIPASFIVKEYSYYKNGKLKSQWDDEGRKTDYEYDGSGNTSKETLYTDKNGGNKVTAYSYNYLNKPYKKSEQVVSGDIFGNALNSTSVISLDTSYSYDLNGNVIKQTNPDGHEIDYSYDNLNRQTSVSEKTIDESGTEVVSTTSKLYEWNGQVKEITDAKGSKTQYQYDAMGVQIAEVNAKGDKISYKHDLLGRVVEKVSAKSRFKQQVPTKEEMQKAYGATEKDDNWNPRFDLNHDGTIDIFDIVIAAKNESSTLSLDELNNHYGSRKGDINWDTTYDLNGDNIVDVLDVVSYVKKLPTQNRQESDYPTKDRLIYNSRGLVIAEEKVDYPRYDSREYVTVTKAYKYDNKGNKIKELDALGYDAGTGSSIEDKINSGYGKEYQYNLSGRLLKETTAATKDKGLEYTHQYKYDGLLRTISDTDANGNTLACTYNNAGKVTSKKLITASGTKELSRYEYDLLDNVTLAVDGNGNKTITVYNSLNKPKQTTLPGDASILADTIVYQYDKLGNQVFSQNSKGIVAKNERDPKGRILRTINTDSAGTDSITQETKYDKNGNKRFVKDGNGNITVYEYDELNRIKATSIDVKNSDGTVVTHKNSYEYDPNGNVIRETDYLGNSKTYNYDIFDRVIEKYDGSNKLVERLEYNKNGTQRRSVDAMGNSTRFEYDKDSRLISKTDGENNKTTQTYDKIGNVDTRTDAKGNKTCYSYDEMNRLKTVLNAKNEATSYVYDNNGNMLEQTDAKGNKTVYEYNVANKVSKIIAPKGKTISGTTITYDATKVQEFTYYEDGSVKTHKDQNGVVTQYNYDIFGRKISEITPTATVSLQYDKNGNQVKMTDSTGVTLREYDALNRVISKTVPNIGKSVYVYDVKDGVDPGFYAEISKDPKANAVKKIYDKSDRLVKVVDGTNTTTYDYYDNGAKKSTVYPDGSREDYQYNKNNTLKNLVNRNNNGTAIESFNYAYDPAGNITTKADKKGQTTYEYDALNRIATVKEPGGKNTSYTYDLSGNRQTETVVQNNVTNITTYSYDEQNRLIQTTKMQDTTVLGYKKYFYDNNGNVIKEVAGLANFVVPNAVSAKVSDIYNSPEKTYDIVKSEIKDKIVAKAVTTMISSSLASDNTKFNEKVVQYSYDNFNQLIEAKNDAGSILKNTYNGEGLRVSKEQGGQKTNLLYEGDKVVLEVDGSSGVEKARNVYGNNLISRRSGSATAYYMYNGHGDVTNLLDGKGGIIGSYYYDAFGNVQENTSSFSNPYRYAGYQYDEEIGKYYLLNRMYDPESARFMQEDSYRGNANDPLSLNLYTYVNNNPMIYDDPNGHWPSFIDSFVSKVSSAASSAWSYVKEKASDFYSWGSSVISSAESYISNKIDYVESKISSAYNWGKKVVNNIGKAYNSAKTAYKVSNYVYKNVVKPELKKQDEELKRGIYVGVSDFVKKIDYGKLMSGITSAGLGGLSIAGGSALMIVPGAQVYGAAIIASGTGSVVYGGGEMLDATAHFNPIRDFAVNRVGISSDTYDLLGIGFTATSGFGVGAYAAESKLGSITDKVNTEQEFEAYNNELNNSRMQIKNIKDSGLRPISDDPIMVKAKKWGCFVAGTKVLTESGNESIEKIKVGDKVLSQNTDTGKQEYKEVKNIYVKEVNVLVHLKIGKNKIDTTTNHPFWLVNKGWVQAGDLKEKDKVLLASGEIASVDSKSIQLLKEDVKVYNLEVADWHTYFVTDEGVLVHNQGPCGETTQGVSNTELPGRNGALNQAKRDAGILRNSRPDYVESVPMREPEYAGGHVIKDADGNIIYTREYHYTNSSGEHVVIQEHSAPHIGSDGPHFNARPITDTRHGVFPGTQEHYPFKK